ncbi:DUF7344 domain-containing protein [Halegenticoccus soli]|uniref:DUF7344 domain-containing protein n=1 Tax=Halegenticoccus soli TaxID=1985678 RepID=UPI000C6EEC7C|nr:hypothetical protein [Halegenticoccus soli]
MAAENSELSGRDEVNDVSELLSNPRRQYVVEALDASDGDSVELAALVDDVRELEAADSGGVTDDRTAVALELHHVHLPKLADIGVATYDADRKRVTPDRTRVADLLRAAKEAYRLLSSDA